MTQIIKPEKKTPEIADILHHHMDDYKAEYPLWPEHRKIVSDLLNCRTAHLGGHIERCNTCGTVPLRIIPAAIAIAPNASKCRGKDGLRKEKTKFYRSTTFMSSLPFRMNSTPSS